MFHKCKALLEDENFEEKLDLGLPIEEKYTRVRFRYSDVTDYLEWGEESETGDVETKGTIVYTFMGRVYYIQTSLEEFDSLMDNYLKDSNNIWSSKIN